MYKILDTLDELYTNNLVYRTIIVCNNTDDYKYILNKKYNYIMIINKTSIILKKIIYLIVKQLDMNK